MAMYRLHRGIDARDVAEGHRLAIPQSDDNYRLFILSGDTPFKRTDCRALKHAPSQVLLSQCPSICELFENRQWPLPTSIDRVYDSSKAQREFGWTPRYGDQEVVDLLDRQISEKFC